MIILRFPTNDLVPVLDDEFDLANEYDTYAHVDHEDDEDIESAQLWALELGLNADPAHDPFDI